MIDSLFGSRVWNTMLACQLTRYSFESGFARYSKRALESQAQEHFYEVFGEKAEHHIRSYP
jgi:hypothetical protein